MRFPLAEVQVADIWWADFSPDDRLLAAGYRSGAVKLWDFPSDDTKPHSPHTGSVCAVFFSPDGRRLASTSFDRTVALRDLFTHREQEPLRGHSRWVWGAAFSPDGRRLATGGTDTRRRLTVGPHHAKRTSLLRGEGKYFYHVAFSPDGSTLMATSYAGIAHLWRAPSWRKSRPPRKEQ